MLNALLDTWGVREGHSYRYLPNTPQEVKSTVSEGVNYVRSQIGAGKDKLGNAFFSGSLKVFKRTIPNSFPANVVLDDKNRTIDPQNSTWDDLGKRNLTFDLV